MLPRFNTILIPVDFTINTEVSVKKALVLCEEANATIHLLHVTSILPHHIATIHQYFAKYSFTGQQLVMEQVKEKLEHWKYFIKDARKDISVCTWILSGVSVEKAIREKAARLYPDLIIIGKNSHRSWLPLFNTLTPTRIARQTGISVLAVKPGAINSDIRTVVVPVGKEFPDKQLALIHMLRRKLRIHIKLIAFQDEQEDKSSLPASLLNVYRILKTNPASQISYDLLPGEQKAKAILKYCKQVNADLLIVTRESETKVGWPNKHISDALPAQSQTQVLAMRPA